MTMKSIVASLLAAAAVISCAKKSDAPSSPSSIVAGDVAAASPLDKAYRLKVAQALEVDRLFDLLPAYLRPTYEKAAFDKTLGATVVTGLKFGGVEGADGFTAARAEFYGVDLEKIERLKTAEAAPPPDAELERVVGKLRLFDVASAGGDENAPKTTIGAVEIDSLRVRQGGLPKEAPASGVAAFFNAFDVAGVYFRDLKIAGVDPKSSDTGAAFDFSAADLRLVGLGGGKLDALLGRDLEYLIRQSPDAIARAGRGLGPAADFLLNGPLRNFIAPENQRMALKTLEWRGMTFAGLMAYGLTGERPPITARDLIDLGTAKITDAETFIGDKRLSIVPLTEISAMEFTWLAPSKVRAVSRGGLFDLTAYVPDKEEAAIRELKARKLDKVKGDSDFAFDWNADKGAAVLSTGFDSTGLADFDLDIALDGLELKKIDTGRAAGARQPAVDLARLKSFSMVLADEQLLDAFFALSATQSKQSAAELRAAAPTLMRLGKLEVERESPRLAGFIDAVADFNEKGGTLEIKASPETPVPLTAISAAAPGGPDAMAAAINLTVVRKPK